MRPDTACGESTAGLLALYDVAATVGGAMVKAGLTPNISESVQTSVVLTWSPKSAFRDDDAATTPRRSSSLAST